MAGLMGIGPLGGAKPRAGLSEGQRLPEQIPLHIHPGHDFNLDSSYSRSHFIPALRLRDRVNYKRVTQSHSGGCEGHLHIPQLPSILLRSPRQAGSTAGHTHKAISSPRVFYKHGR